MVHLGRKRGTGVVGLLTPLFSPCYNRNVMTPPQPEKDRRQQIINLTIAGIAGQVGCLTLIIVLLAVFGGIWLDARLGTRPWFTLGLLVLSIPISLAAMFYVVKTAVSKIKPIPPQATKSTLKEADLGDDA